MCDALLIEVIGINVFISVAKRPMRTSIIALLVVVVWGYLYVSICMYIVLFACLFDKPHCVYRWIDDQSSLPALLCYDHQREQQDNKQNNSRFSTKIR